MLTFVQYTDKKLMPSAIYRHSSLDQHLHSQEIGDLKLYDFLFKQQNNAW